MSSKEGKSNGADLLETASQKSMEGQDPRIIGVLKTLLAAAKQPPRTRIRLAIDDIYYLLERVCRTSLIILIFPPFFKLLLWHQGESSSHSTFLSNSFLCPI